MEEVDLTAQETLPAEPPAGERTAPAPLTEGRATCAFLHQDYEHDIAAHLFATESKLLPPADYAVRLSKSKFLPCTHERVAVRMFEIGAALKLMDETVALAVSYFDRLVVVANVRRTYVDLAALSCLHLATKYREIRLFYFDQLLPHSRTAYTFKEMRSMELLVLKVLEWNLNSVVPHHFFDWLYTHVPAHVRTLGGDAFWGEAVRVVNFTMQITPFVGRLPSAVAAAALLCAVDVMMEYHVEGTQRALCAAGVDEATLAKYHVELLGELGRLMPRYNERAQARAAKAVTPDSVATQPSFMVPSVEVVPRRLDFA